MDQNSKQLAVEQIKRAANVLVTVSTNPSVDQLSAALGLTMMLTKMGKHTTAVVSGKIPPAISFLDPSKTFTESVDGLRDFIIALDKEKADKLRYKVEDNVVKIFITPYDGEISQKDLQFSQGDFNVDVVVALGVTNKQDLDTAISAHGRILHDATVVTINAGKEKSNLGAVDWQDQQASSLSEMMVSVSEAFQGGLLDPQISTALLTGIDAATDRFSNDKTSPKIMTMAAQLMAAGANQQLIATNLQVKKGGAFPPQQPPKDDGSEIKLDHTDGSAEQPPAPEPVAAEPMPMEPPSPQPPAVPDLPPVSVAPSADTPPVDALPQMTPPGLPPMPDASPTLPGASVEPTMPAPTPAPPEPQFPPIIKDSQKQGAPPPSPEPPAPTVVPGPPPGSKSLNQIEDEIAALATTPAGKAVHPTEAIPPNPEPPTIQKNTQTRLPDADPAPTMQEIEDARNVRGSIVGEGPEPEPGTPKIGKAKGKSPADMADKPILGGTFNATTDDAHDENEQEMLKDKNKAILDHSKKDEEAPAGPQIDVEAARKEAEQAIESQSFDPANNPVESLGAAPMEGEEPASTEIAIDANGNISPAPPPTPPETQTLSIPGASAAPPPAPTPAASGMPPLAGDSLDAPPPLPNPPGPPPNG